MGKIHVKRLLFVALMSIGLIGASIATASVATAAGTETYTGQGISNATGSYLLNTPKCGEDRDAAGAYIYWKFTATRSDNAVISGPWTMPQAMTKQGNGSFFFISSWYPLGSLIGNVSATFDGDDINPQLTISHGCAPVDVPEKPAWCSPGFWKNALDAAWATTGYSKESMFNTTVYNKFFGTLLDPSVNLGTVLSTRGGMYKGAPVSGSSGYPLNAYNAVAAFLSDNIVGYQFSYADYLNETEESCPLDHHGNFKTGS